MIQSTNGSFLYSQAGHSDLQGSVWDPNFHGEDEFHYTYGQSTPRGQDQTEALDETTQKWINADQPAATVAKPTRRVNSRSSSGSRKNKTMKTSAQKARSKVLSAPQSSQMPSVDLTGNAQVDAYLLSDSDTHSVSSQLYYQPLPLGVGLPTDGLPCSPAIPASGMSQHIDPAQMQLDFDTSLPGNSPSWSAFSPVESRLSSPALAEDASAWSVHMDTSPTHTSDSSPIIHDLSPSLDRQMGLMSTEDPTGLVLSEDAMALTTNFTRRSSGDGESSARDHPLYKNAFPQADGLFHCPWEGQSCCNHKPEKLKCNYDKFVDSHLKPYRCKIEACENARFSSTACLLRHEREAHAMHGHGDKPYLCTYDGCDRALPGNGFPRQWNLKDHMRRVHNDNGSSLNVSSGSPPSGHGSHSHSTKARKRKNKDSADGGSSRKQSSRSAHVVDTATAVGDIEQPMLDEWNRHRQALTAYLQEYSTPDAFEQVQHLPVAKDHLDAMGKISQKLRASRKGHSHDSYRRSHGHHSG